MQRLYDIPAPAKLNLFLHVLGQRSDGYHFIESAFMLIDWCDTLHLELRLDGGISRADNAMLPPDDLCTRAARALQMHTDTSLGVHIVVEKNIPSQAGLGGGSSDAASVLLALNYLWNLHLPLQTLLQLGARLGADVPFFLGGGNAWVQGIGEKLTPINLPEQKFVVLKPKAGLETTAVFRHSKPFKNIKPAIISSFARKPFAFGENALQAVAVELSPAIGQALVLLQTLGLAGRMTGSGSAVFAPLPAKMQFEKTLVHDVFTSRVCSNLQEHPLAGWLVP